MMFKSRPDPAEVTAARAPRVTNAHTRPADGHQAKDLVWRTRAARLADPVAFFEAAGVGLSDGADFDAPGYVRLNFGCCRSLLSGALEPRVRVNSTS
jgi:hypothetical protein